MQVKDYYAILEVSPAATRDEIKQAYRKLALRFHPDKTENDPYTNARFREIKEAYEVLTTPARKQEYLNQRWYEKSQGRKQKVIVVTPDYLLQEAIALDRQLAHADRHRMNREALLQRLLELLNDDTIQKMAAFQDTGTIDEAAMLLLKSGRLLPAASLAQITARIHQLPISNSLQQSLPKILHAQQRTQRLERLTPWIALLAVLLVCLFLFLLQR